MYICMCVCTHRHKRCRFDPWGGEEPLVKGMAAHSRVLAWRIDAQRSLAGYGPWGCEALDTTDDDLADMHMCVYIYI